MRKSDRIRFCTTLPMYDHLPSIEDINPLNPDIEEVY